MWEPIGDAGSGNRISLHSARTTRLPLHFRHRRILAPGVRIQAHSDLARLTRWLSGMRVRSSLSPLGRRPNGGTAPPTTCLIISRASCPRYAIKAVTVSCGPAPAWAARFAQIRCNACTFSSTYSSVFWLVIERRLRSLGRSMPSSTA